MSKHPRHHADHKDEPVGRELNAGPGADRDRERQSDAAEPIEVSESAAEVVRQLQTERDEAIEGRLRALADFRNYQRRATDNELRALSTGAIKVVKAMLPALDHFDLALNQRADQMNLKQLLAAVSIVRDEFNKALQAQGVERIAPKKGEPFDPNRHEAVMRQEEPGVPPNTIVSTLQAGYAMGDIVLRPAKVAVAPSDET